MRLYRIREDVDKFQSISPIDDEIWSTDSLIFDVARKKLNWEPVKCYVQNPKLPRAGFSYLCPGLLLFNQDVLEKMEDILEMAGEILPFDLDGETVYGLNVLECPNALDQTKTEWKISPSTGAKLGINSYSFHFDRLYESSIFKIPETSRSEIFCFVGLKDIEDEFKGRYDQLGLTGLVFEEV